MRGDVRQGPGGAEIGIFAHGFTYSAHPVACAVTLETLKTYEERKILNHVCDLAPVFQKRLHSLGSHPLSVKRAALV
jgi:4-aminobutyrate--pyruvate transaminase